MGEPWRILVVDDEEDVHQVTRLALRRRTWLGRAFEIVGAASATEARTTLAEMSERLPEVALIDVVMETPDAGLKLCADIRERYPASLRIILRTGQPGMAPEEKVLNDFDIDHYMAKAEVTNESLFAAIRACLRSSRDIQTLLMLSQQMASLTELLQEPTDCRALVRSFAPSLSFLARKYDCALLLEARGEDDLREELRAGDAMPEPLQAPTGGIERGRLCEIPGTEGAFVLRDRLGESTIASPERPSEPRGFFSRFLASLGGSQGARITVAPVELTLGVRMNPAQVSPKSVRDLERDWSTFVHQWNLGMKLLQVQELVAKRMAGEELASSLADLHG